MCVKGIFPLQVASVSSIPCWSQENSGKHVNWPVTTASDSQSTATSRVCTAADTDFTPPCCLNPQYIRAVELNCKTGCLKSANHRISFGWRKLHFNQGGYKYPMCTRILPLRSFSFIYYYCRFPFLHSPSRTITRCSQSWECKHVIFGVFQWLNDVTFHLKCLWTVSTELRALKRDPQLYLKHNFKSFPDLLSPLINVDSHPACGGDKCIFFSGSF